MASKKPNESLTYGRFTPERLGYWYLRLNGYFLLENFVVHPDTGRDQRTDADLIGIRLAHRAENPIRPMRDDPRICTSRTLLTVVIAEVKTGLCDLNGPWTCPEKENVQRVLRAIGCVPESAISIVAEELYAVGFSNSPDCTCRLLAFGDRQGALPIAGVQQVLFNEMIDFILSRFREYQNEKSSVGNWTDDGRELARLARSSRRSINLVGEIRSLFGLPPMEVGWEGTV